jgi:hypothetical protein
MKEDVPNINPSSLLSVIRINYIAYPVKVSDNGHIMHSRSFMFRTVSFVAVAALALPVAAAPINMAVAGLPNLIKAVKAIHCA